MSRTLKKYNEASLIKPAHQYQWKGLTQWGETRHGIMEASSKTHARIELGQQGILVKTLKKRFRFNRGINSMDRMLFTRHLATFTKAGIGLMQAIEFYKKDHAHPGIRTLLSSIQSDLEAGLLFAEVLRRHPMVFNRLFCSLVHAGEQSGTLDVMFEKIAIHQEKRARLLKKIRKACAYPTAVILMAIMVNIGLLVFVIPQFERLFTDFGAEIPAFTRFVINGSTWIQTHGLILMLISVIIPLLWIQTSRYSSTFVHWQHTLLLKIPLIGGIIQKTVIARFAHVLSILFGAGLPLTEALTTVADATGNRLYAKGIHAIELEITSGQRLCRSMQNSTLFPSLVSQLIAIGEESGTLEQMLMKVATMYDEDIDHAIDALSGVLEPLIMAILGLLVGGLVIAMYLPILSLGTVV